MSEPAKAVFLSYARDDAAAARRMADALRSQGLEVWFDENELRGGDAWDAKIRKQIDACALFLPIISAHTQERSKGYFRLEWKLAVDQTHLLAEGVPFIAPVVIDDTKESAAVVPPEFMKVQWTRLPGALPTPQFVEQVKRLMSKEQGAGSKEQGRAQRTDASAAARKTGLPGWAWGAVTAVVVGITVVLYVSRQHATPVAASASEPKPAPTAPALDEKSVAVLAFADLSEARNNEYFSDGVSEELLNVLAKVSGLRVAARTSAFFFKGKNLPIAEIAAKLNVAYVVEGSVQRAGERVKITAQLIKAADGYHVWSESFTRDAKDVFAVQDEIAGLIAKQLSLKLGASSAAATAAVNPEAFEFFVQARQAWNQRTARAYARAEVLLQRALDLDPDFVRARALLALVWTFQAVERKELGLFSQRDAPGVGRLR
ncbi:MAG: TIR domain-containing protein, partial [Lacunisphaera sp.]|nr:TIR domain-containing protein [Lacunisphaera sp.]